jgi:hypothetical protein
MATNTGFGTRTGPATTPPPDEQRHPATAMVMDTTAELGLAVSVPLALGLAFLLALAFSGMIVFVDRFPIYLTAVSGAAIGAVAAAPLRRPNVIIGIAAASFAALSAAMVAYVVGRHDLVELFGIGYEVPLWLGWPGAKEVAVSTLDANPTLGAVDVLSIGCAFVWGAGLPAWWNRRQLSRNAAGPITDPGRPLADPGTVVRRSGSARDRARATRAHDEANVERDRKFVGAEGLEPPTSAL